MECPFALFPATAESQLGEAPCTVEDTPLVAEWRNKERTYENLLEFGKALSKSLRYKEAIEVYTEAISMKKEPLEALRLRAGRYLSILENKKAEEDFLSCLRLGGEPLDCRYRLGLSLYYQKRYQEAMEEWEKVLSLSDPEMEIALLYWHSLASLRLKKEPFLLARNVSYEAVGHHRSYWEGVSFLKGEMQEEELLDRAGKEEVAMEASMKLYALHVWNEAQEKEDNLLKVILSQQEYWFCFTSLAAWNDYYRN